MAFLCSACVSHVLRLMAALFSLKILYFTPQNGPVCDWPKPVHKPKPKRAQIRPQPGFASTAVPGIYRHRGQVPFLDSDADVEVEGRHASRALAALHNASQRPGCPYAVAPYHVTRGSDGSLKNRCPGPLRDVLCCNLTEPYHQKTFKSNWDDSATRN